MICFGAALPLSIVPEPTLSPSGRPFVTLDRALRQGLPLGATTEVQGSGQKPYVITHHPDGVWSCSCPAWRMQRAGADVRTCKHVNLVRAGTLGSAPARAPSSFVARPSTSFPPAHDERRGQVLLAETWDQKQDLTGWMQSEKLNGVRGEWCDGQLWSRGGNRFAAPAWFTEGFPTGVLDGELYKGRGPGVLQETISTVTKDTPIDAEWKALRYHVFDRPAHPGPFTTRYSALESLIASLPAAVRRRLVLVPHTRIQNNAQLLWDFRVVKDGQGEGLMARDPTSRYEAGRSSSLLKIIERQHGEVRIVGYLTGTGKNKGRLGSYVVRFLDTDVEFKVGSGIPEAQRDRPLSVGTVITISFAERTLTGKGFQPAYEVEHGIQRKT